MAATFTSITTTTLAAMPTTMPSSLPTASPGIKKSTAPQLSAVHCKCVSGGDSLMDGFPSVTGEPVRFQHNLRASVDLVVEHGVAARCLFERQPVTDDEARIDLSFLDALQKRPQIALHVALPGANGQ